MNMTNNNKKVPRDGMLGLRVNPSICCRSAGSTLGSSKTLPKNWTSSRLRVRFSSTLLLITTPPGVNWPLPGSGLPSGPRPCLRGGVLSTAAAVDVGEEGLPNTARGMDAEVEGSSDTARGLDAGEEGLSDTARGLEELVELDACA